MADNIKIQEKELSMEDRMAQQLCSYHIGLDGMDSSDKPFKYVMTGNGVMRIMKNPIGVFIAKADKIQGLPEIKEGLLLSIPKIPYYMFQQTIAFFKEVMKRKNGAEAMLQFYYDKDADKYIVHCPDQTVSGASVIFKRNEELDNKYILVMDIHSHNSMAAFFSSVDNADEKETRIFGVVGNLNLQNPSWKFRICVGGVYKDVDLFDIFERPFPAASFPQEWLDKCKRATHATVHGRSGAVGGTVYSGGKVVGDTKYTRRNYLGQCTALSKYGAGKDDYDSYTRNPYNYNEWDDYDEFEEVYSVFGVPINVKTDVSADPLSGIEDVATPKGNGKPASYESYLLENEIYTMTSDERITLVKELLLSYPEDVAKAIYDEAAYDDIQRELLKLAAEEAGDTHA